MRADTFLERLSSLVPRTHARHQTAPEARGDFKDADATALDPGEWLGHRLPVRWSSNVLAIAVLGVASSAACQRGTYPPPEGGVYVFDGAMIQRRDGGPPIDASRADAGRPIDAARGPDAFVRSDAFMAGGACVVDGDRGCICRAPREGDVPFDRRCDQAAFPGEPTVCCRGSSYCFCERVRCGVASDGTCLCGISFLVSRTIVDTCDGTASTCCTQDTGYCYCEEGCEERFANRRVLSCNTATDTATCASDETPVSSCE